MPTDQIANTVVPVPGVYTIRPQDPAVRLKAPAASASEPF